MTHNFQLQYMYGFKFSCLLVEPLCSNFISSVVCKINDYCLLNENNHCFYIASLVGKNLPLTMPKYLEKLCLTMPNYAETTTISEKMHGWNMVVDSCSFLR